MNRILFKLFSLLLCCYFSTAVVGQSNIEKLEYLYGKSLGNDDSLIFRQQFFESFPKTFLEFREFYNNPKSPLYSHNSEHMGLFSTLDEINDTIYMRRLIDLSIGGYWDADAVTRLQLLIGKKIFDNPKLLGYLLANRTPSEVRSFSYFYFDGINVRFKSFPLNLEVIQENNRFVYKLMNSTFENVKSDRSDLKNLK